jgi:hypothetical protein
MEGKIIITPDDFAPNDFAKSCLAAQVLEGTPAEIDRPGREYLNSNCEFRA